jgi:hypothetical protein
MKKLKDKGQVPSSLPDLINKIAHLPVQDVIPGIQANVIIFPRLEVVMAALQNVSLFSKERKNMETIFWNQSKHLPKKLKGAGFAVYNCNLSDEDYMVVQELMFVAREGGRSEEPKACKKLTAMFSPKYTQQQKEVDPLKTLLMRPNLSSIQSFMVPTQTYLPNKLYNVQVYNLI